MHRKPLKTWLPFRLAALVVTLNAAWPQRALAANGSWNADAAGNWSDTTKWTPAAVPGTAEGDVVNLTFNITAARTVTIDTTSRTVGDLNIGDPTATLFGYTLAASGTGVVLNLNGTGTTAGTIDFTTAVANTISAPINLVDNGVIRSNSALVQTLSGVISGSGKTLTFNNDVDGTVNAAGATLGQFLVTGNNTYTGGTTISDVRVNITTNNTALGTGAVTVNNGGQFFASTALTSIANTFNIAGNGWVETAANQPFGAMRLEGGAVITGNVNMTANAAIGGNSGTGTVNGIISGTGFTLSKRGGSTLILGGANTYTGGTDIVAGVLQTNHNSGLGSGTVTLSGASSRLQINGGVTIANEVNVGTGVTGAVGTGLVQQVGTGLARVNGTVSLNSVPNSGGTFLASNAAGSGLVLGGAVNSTANLGASQRDGNVTFAGGGNATGTFITTGTTIAGATNGIPQGWSMVMGGSGAATLNLNGFDQTLAGLKMGNTGAGSSSSAATVALGANTLTLNSDLSTQLAATVTAASHNITAAPGGTLAFGATPRNIDVADNTFTPNDLTITGATLTGAGLTKTGTGTLGLGGVTLSTPLTVSTGTLQTGTTTAAGSINAGLQSFTMASGTTLAMKLGTLTDLISAGAFSNAGTTTLSVTQTGGGLANGTYPLIDYTGGTSPGTAGFALQPVGHALATLTDTGTAIALSVTGNDKVIWDGTSSSAWATGTTGNWKLQSSPSTATDFITGDDVIFQDTPTSTAVAIAANVTPSTVTFTNSTATAYALSGAGGITGYTGLSKTGNGTVTLSNPNTYTGATTIGAGTLVANHSTATPLPAGSAVSLAAGATLRLEHTGGAFNLVNPVTGAGTIIIDPGTTTAGARDLANVTWNNSGFSGTLKLAPTTGTMRIAVDNPSDLGTGTVEIASGGQLFVNAANQTFANNFSIAGTGYSEAAGTLGAIRASNPTTFTGNITLTGPAKIGALGGTAIIAGTLGGNVLTFGGSVNNTGGETLAITGDASGLTGLIVNDGSATSAPTSIAVNVGNGTSTGTIGSVPVSLLADGFKNSVIRFDRTDGYTLGGAITSTSAAANHVRTFVDADSQGTGFSDGGLAINLGGSTATTGGQFRVGQNRANSVANISGALTAGQFLVGANQTGTVVNLNSGAAVNVGTARIALGGAVNSASTLNINNGSSFTAFSLGLGEVGSGIGVVNQATGSAVSIDAQLRIGHFGTNTSTYNMNGGTLSMTGASPLNSPSTAGAGGNASNGDNNLNTLATAAVVGGGIYLGVDGTGIFNHTGGTVTTNWIVLDNRGASGAGANMVDGIDRYNLSGAGSVLNLRSTWGLIGRNEGSYAVSFGGGTVKVDNTGTGGPAGNTGANITVPLDATIDTVASTTTKLDTNGAGNGFTLTKDVRGTGSLELTGGGSVNLNTSGIQSITAPLTTSGTAISALNKTGNGTTTVSDVTALAAPINVNAGRLNLDSNFSNAISVAAGASLSGEPANVTTLTLGGGGTLFFDPATSGALTTGTLNATGVTTLDALSAPVGSGPFPVINFTTSGVTPANFVVASAASYRTTPTVNVTSSAVEIGVTPGIDLTWTGASSNAWVVGGATSNWNNTTPAADLFYSLDKVTLPEGAANTSIALTGLIAPGSITANAATTNYTLTSTAGNQLAGGTGITKTGASTLTLVGPNLHRGTTSVGGGIVSIASEASLGDATAATNTIALSGGGRLNITAANNLGVNRDISVGTGGGTLSYSAAAGGTVTVPGDLSGAGALTVSSTLAGGGTFALAGSNAGYTGPITVDSLGLGLTTLSIPTAASVPAASAITLNYPAAGASLNATTLSLGSGVSLPATTALNFTSKVTGTTAAQVSLRTGMALTGAITIDSPISLSGSSIIQFNAGNTSTAVTYNGAIGESAPGAFAEDASIVAFGNTLFLRGTGTHVVNGKITLPSAGSTVAVTDGATAIINSTGNDFKSASAAFGVLRIGADNALPTTARLVIGQSGDQGALFDLNGYNQTVSGLEWQAPNGNTLAKGITNSHASTFSTFTLNQATAPVQPNFNGTIAGRTHFVKTGAATTTLAAGASNFTGNVTVSGGTLVASATGNDAGTSGSLGAANVAGKTVTVGSGATLSFTSNNIFGNAVANANLPKTIVDGGTLTSTRYNVLGDVELKGGSLTQASTDSGGYQGYQFRGTVSVTGSTPSTITTTNAKGNHLAANTEFSVSDVTGSSAVDLTVSAPLLNQSADFSSAAGGFTKSGAGTMHIPAGITSSYTGATVVSGGVLRVDGDISSSSGVTVTGGTLSGTGDTPALTLGDGSILAPGNSPGILSTGSVTTTGGVLGTGVQIEIGGLTAGTDYDQIQTTGTLTLNGGVLSVSLINSFTPAVGDTFYMWLNDGTDLIGGSPGTFTGLAEGASIPAPAGSFTISYVANGDGGAVGNDVSLTYVPEPGTGILLLLAGSGFLRRRRRA